MAGPAQAFPLGQGPNDAIERNNRLIEENNRVIGEHKGDDEENEQEIVSPQDLKDQARHYRFPLNIGENFPAYIQFKVIKVQETDTFSGAGLKKIAVDSFNYVQDLIVGAQTQESESTADQTTTAANKAKQIKDSDQKRKELLSYENNTGGTPLGDITLPLQSPLRYDDVANYGSTSLGVFGGAIENTLLGDNPFAGATENGQLYPAAKALAANAIGRAAGAAGGLLAGALTSGKGGAIFGAVLGANIGEGLGAATQNATRVTAAPNQRTTFESVQIRPFAFDFKMIATSQKEAIEIKNIVKMFREELYPEKISIGTSGVPLAYKFPNMFEIVVKNRFKDATPGFKIQRCYLRSMNTTFGEQNGMYSDGSFIDVTINLSFQEIVALDKQKVRDGY